jgi:hypothetical protein
MTDEQFRELRQLALEQNVRISELALTVRTLQRRMEEIVSMSVTQDIAHIGGQEELDAFLASYQKRSPST